MEVGYFERGGFRFYFVVVEGVATRAVPGLDGYWHLISEAAALGETFALRRSLARLRDGLPERWSMRAIKWKTSGKIFVIVERGDGTGFAFQNEDAAPSPIRSPQELAEYVAELSGDAVSPAP